MHTVPLGLRWLGVVLLCLLGCQTADRPIKRPQHPQEWIEPPKEEARFGEDVTFPKETLKTDEVKSELATGPMDNSNGAKNPPRSAHFRRDKVPGERGA